MGEREVNTNNIVKVYIKNVGYGTLITTQEQADGSIIRRVTRPGWGNGFTDLPQDRVIIIYPNTSVKPVKIQQLLENYN